MQKLPKGHSNFKKIRKEGLYYVDKSLLIEEVLADTTEVILLPRPRRFGKTLNLSLLHYFFERREEDNAALFEGLQIAKRACFALHQGRYPVIFMTFKGIKMLTYENAEAQLKLLIANEFRKHSYLLSSSYLKQEQKQDFKQVYLGKAKIELFQNGLKDLASYLSLHHQEKVVILIDEYDTPIQAAWLNDYYIEMIDFMRVFLGEGLKGNEHLFKSVLTGIMRVSKESIFSGLNNIWVYTTTSNQYADKFGFTEPEVALLIEALDLADKQTVLKDWYNGYQAGNITIYNPWSVINYLSSQDAFPRPYWVNTSDNSLLRQLIFDADLNVNEEIEDLLKGRSIQKRLDENIVFRDISKDDTSLFSFLYFSGYLKHEKLLLIEDELHGDLKIPNKEVRIFYKNVVQSWLNYSPSSNNSVKDLLTALLNQDVRLFERLFSNFIRDTLSYFDTNKKTVEAVYQAFLLGMLVNLASDYEIVSNRESGYGRYDIALIPKDKQRLGIIMELKVVDDFYDETKEEALVAALQQIEEKEYEAGLRKQGITNILILAVTFDGKRVWVREG